MIKKSLLLGSLLFLLSENVLALVYDLLGYDQCVSIDKISHVSGQHWKIMDSAWTLSKENTDSATPFSVETAIHRTVEPYHIIGYSLADVTCDYQSGTLVLTRTYKEDNPPFPTASYIIADTNTNKIGGWFFWNNSTSTSCTLGSLDKCKWAFYSVFDDDPGP